MWSTAGLRGMPEEVRSSEGLGRTRRRRLSPMDENEVEEDDERELQSVLRYQEGP
jgi:hypothetical protein